MTGRLREKICPSCRAPNPSTAYACLNCYQVMDKKYKVPFWKIHIDRTISILFLITIGMVGGLWFIKKWSEAFEAEMSIRIRTAEYQISFVAGKSRHESAGVKSDSQPAQHPELE